MSLADTTTLPSQTGLLPFAMLAKASFNGIAFRVESVQIKGGLRDHVHEYPHSPGGQPEKLGRKLYEITMSAVFIFQGDDLVFPNAWNGDISALVAFFEAQISADLVIPTVGTIKAYAKDWDRTNTNKMMNGERMTIVFREDQEVEQLVSSAIDISYTTTQPKYDVFLTKASDAGLGLDLFASIAQLVSDLQGIKDQVDLQASLIATKAEQLADACRFFDESVTQLNDPAMCEVVSALHDLGVAAGNLANDALAKLTPLAAFVVPIPLTVMEVSTAIYGDTSRAMDLMQLNAFDNPFDIEPGFEVIYYQIPSVGGVAA